jgi:hypothetical protein
MQPLRHDRGLEPPSPTWEHYLVTIFLCKVQFIKRSANIYIYSIYSYASEFRSHTVRYTRPNSFASPTLRLASLRPKCAPILIPGTTVTTIITFGTPSPSDTNLQLARGESEADTTSGPIASKSAPVASYLVTRTMHGA